MWEQLLNWSKAVFSWMVGVLKDISDWVVGLIFDVLPESVQMEWEWIGPYASTANAWLPLQEFFTLLGVLWSFQATFIIAKFVWKAIPSTG